MHQSNNLVTMGKIVNAFGVQGWVKIKTNTQDCSSLSNYRHLYLLIDGTWSEHEVEKSFAKESVFHAKFKGIANRDEALALKGVIAGVPRDQFPKLSSDEYYWIDLIGLEVYNMQQELLGIVDSLMETGANSVLVIKHELKQHLIPFVAVYVLNVDLTNRKILVDWGLDY